MKPVTGTTAPGAGNISPAVPAGYSKEPGFWEPTSVITLSINSDTTTQSFTVHKEFACHHSPVLNAAFCSNAFLESQTQTYHLDETSACTARLLIAWLYTQRLDTRQRRDPDCKSEEDIALLGLWILADRLLIPRLQNQVIVEIESLKKFNSGPSIQGLGYVYENTAIGSPLRAFLVHQCVYDLHSRYFLEMPSLFPKTMLVEMATVFRDYVVEKEKIQWAVQRSSSTRESHRMPPPRDVVLQRDLSPFKVKESADLGGEPAHKIPKL